MKYLKWFWTVVTFWKWFKTNSMKFRALYKCIDRLIRYMSTNPDLTKVSRKELVDFIVEIQTQMKVVDEIGMDVVRMKIEGVIEEEVEV